MTNEVSGSIVFDEQAGPVQGATLRIRLEDVSSADAPSREVGYVELADCSHAPGDPPIAFVVTTDELDPTGRYSVRVHLDMDGSGEYTSGDQITTQSYPVITHGYPDAVEVQLHQITGHDPRS